MTDKLTDRLIARIDELKNPSVVGLDTSFDYLPDDMKKPCKTLEDAAKAITEFNYRLIDKTFDIIPAVKVQVAYYEMYGVEGLKAFENTVRYAREKGLVVIGDVKRNDIGSTASCYSKAYLGSIKVNDNVFSPFPCDYITVNGYLGEDGIKPFVEDVVNFDKGIFVLVKPSNPSSGQLQNKKFEDGNTLFESMGKLVEQWGEPTIGKYGYSAVGAVVGATHPREAEILRQLMPHTLFLVPGYGAQGGTANDLKVCFDDNHRGAIVNSSRGIITAYKKSHAGMKFDDAARAAAIDMQQDLYKAIYC